MSDTTQTPQPSPSGEEKPRRRFLRHAALATVIAGVPASASPPSPRAAATGDGSAAASWAPRSIPR